MSTIILLSCFRRLSALRQRHDTSSAVGYDNNLEVMTNASAPPSYEDTVCGSLNSIADLPPRYSEVIRNKYITTIPTTRFSGIITTNLDADESVMTFPMRNLDQSHTTDAHSAERQGVILSPSTLERVPDVTHSVNETLELR